MSRYIFWKCWQLKLTLTVGKPKKSMSTLFTLVTRNVWLAGAPSIRIVTSNTFRSLFIAVASYKSKWEMIFVLSFKDWEAWAVRFGRFEILEASNHMFACFEDLLKKGFKDLLTFAFWIFSIIPNVANLTIFSTVLTFTPWCYITESIFVVTNVWSIFSSICVTKTFCIWKK